MLSLSQIKTFLRSGPYAWPGGYQLYFIMGDGEPASFGAVRAEWTRICRAYISPTNRDKEWQIAGADIHWEGPDLHCCLSNAPIPSAYGEGA